MRSGDYEGLVKDAAFHKTDSDRMEGVRRAVARSGIRDPLEVHRWPASSWSPVPVDELANGHHRFIAAAEQGLTHVPVRFVQR